MEVAAPTPANSRVYAARKVYARSRVTNHRDVLSGIDGRGAIARRYRDIVSAIASDQGGVSRLAEIRLQLIRRYAACCVLAEELEARLVNGGKIDIGEHAQLSSTLCRLASRIGVDRVPVNITPTLDQYLTSQQEAAE
jgi:hypothetical protein